MDRILVNTDKNGKYGIGIDTTDNYKPFVVDCGNDIYMLMQSPSLLTKYADVVVAFDTPDEAKEWLEIHGKDLYNSLNMAGISIDDLDVHKVEIYDYHAEQAREDAEIDAQLAALGYPYDEPHDTKPAQSIVNGGIKLFRNQQANYRAKADEYEKAGIIEAAEELRKSADDIEESIKDMSKYLS